MVGSSSSRLFTWGKKWHLRSLQAQICQMKEEQDCFRSQMHSFLNHHHLNTICQGNEPGDNRIQPMLQHLQLLAKHLHQHPWIMTWNPPAQQSAWSSPMSSCISQPLQRSSSSGAWLCQMGMMQTQQLWWPPILVWNWLGSFAVENRHANHQLSGKRPFEIYIIDHHGILQLCVTGM